MADGLRPAAQVRVKRCGKSAPAPGVTRVARQTPPGARPDRGSAARTSTPPGGLLEPAGNRRPRGMAAGGRASVRNRIRRIGRLTTTNEADQGGRAGYRAGAVTRAGEGRHCRVDRTPGRVLVVGQQVRVAVQRLADARMPESGLDDLDRLAVMQQRRGVGVPQGVEPGALLDARGATAGGQTRDANVVSSLRRTSAGP